MKNEKNGNKNHGTTTKNRVPLHKWKYNFLIGFYKAPHVTHSQQTTIYYNF